MKFPLNKKHKEIIYCILCGLCWACPVSKINPYYLGPAQLAKVNRLVRDSRLNDQQQNLILSRILQDDAVPACERFFVCNMIFSKGVMPGTAIKDIRDSWMDGK